MSDSVSLERLSADIKSLEYAGGHQTRVNFTAGNDSAAVLIKKRFDEIPGLTKVEVDTFFISSASAPYNSKPLCNVVGTLEGKKFPGQYYLVGGHYDCSASRMGTTIWNQQWKTIKAPGADDNATGVAAVLEMARLMSDTSFGFISDYTIKFAAFGAEESGPVYSNAHHGSVHYAKTAKQRGDNILGMISVDMIGYNNFFDYTEIVSNSSSQWLGEKFIDAKNLYGINIQMNQPPFTEAAYSDHASFWDEGYKAILIIENGPPWVSHQYYQANPDYHKSSDTFDKLNMQLVKKVTQLTLTALASLSSRLSDLDEKRENVIADNFILYQNYPNPFNPVTKIRFSIPSVETEFIPSLQLRVYDLLGREVATLVDEEKAPGNYEVIFNAEKLSSGVYFYKLQAEGFSLIKKCILLR